MASNVKTIKKLQLAINMSCSFKILYTTTQFYSVKQNRSVTKYCLRKAIVNNETLKSTSEEIFSTYSQLQVVMYLRDLWCICQGKELPTDNEVWENIKAQEKITLQTYKDVIADE